MKIYCIFFLIIGSLLTCSCTKEPINNNVEGLWILKEFTTLKDNKTTKCNRLYYSITRMVTEISEKQGNNGYGTYIGRTEYSHNEKQLVLKDFKIRQATSDSGKDAPVDKLRHFGINNQKITVFDILECDGKKMILQSDYARLQLEKF